MARQQNDSQGSRAAGQGLDDPADEKETRGATRELADYIKSMVDEMDS